MGCKFKVGQRIVAVRDHSTKDFIKDDEFTVLEIDSMCDIWVIKIYPGNLPTVSICKHGNQYIFKGKFYNENAFAPLEDKGEEHKKEMSNVTIDEIIKLFEPKKQEDPV